MTKILSTADVARLLADPSAEARADVAAKLAQQVDGDALSTEERAIADDILRALCRDAALRVRQALSDHLKESRHLPRDVALVLAQDVDAVALPVLSHSLALTDADLIAIVRSSGVAKQVAIAGRAHVSGEVSEALVEADQPAALATLVGNAGAELGDGLLQRVLDRHAGNEAIAAPLAQRSGLPVTVLERLVAAASSSLREILAKRADLPDHVVSDLVLDTQERATASLFSPRSAADESYNLAKHLKRSGRLTPPLIIRAICLGDLAFVEAAFAVLAELPLHNARLLLHDAGALGFRAIYERTRLPSEFVELFRVGLKVAQQTDFDGGSNDLERHRRRSLERILTQYEDFGTEDLDYLISKLRAATAA